MVGVRRSTPPSGPPVISVILIGLGVGAGALALLALHLLPTGLSPARNPVSQYGITPYRAGYRVQTIAYALAGVGAAIGMAAIPGSSLVVGLLLLFAASRLAIRWFPMDTPGTTPTVTGVAHGVLAAIAFGSVGLAALRLPTVLSKDGLDPGIGLGSGVLAAGMLLCFILMAVERRSRSSHYGLVERIFYGSMTVWLVLVALLVLP